MAVFCTFIRIYMHYAQVTKTSLGREVYTSTEHDERNVEKVRVEEK